MDKTFTQALLPYYFKKIGFAYVILILPLFVCDKIFSIPIWEYLSISKEIFKTYTGNVFVLAMYFIVMSKEKIEDEMTMHIRLNNMAISFQTFCFVILLSLFNSAFDGIQINKVSPRRVIFILFFCYQMSFYWYKWKAKREEKRNAEAE